MLSRDSARIKRTLQLRDIKPEDSHAKRERDSWEQIQILRHLVECWWMLEYTKTTGTDRHEREELHDDEVDEVDARGFVELLIGIVLIDGVRQAAIAEPEIAERDAATL